eukprot:6206816-Pleurochrysis_carterae.AAC.1
MGDAVEPEPMQADLPMQSDPGTPASFKDIASIADVNERNKWHRAHYADIDGLYAPCTRSRPGQTQESTLRPWGAPPATGRNFEHTFSVTVKHTTLRTILAIAAEHDVEVQGGDVTQAYLQADWPTEQKVYPDIPEGYKRRQKNGREMVAE